MSGGESEVVIDPVPATAKPTLGQLGDQMRFPSFSMARYGFKRGDQWVSHQIKRYGYVMRCGWCKNLIEEEYAGGGMLRYTHIAGVISRCREIVPYRAST